MAFFESVWYLLILIGIMIVIHEFGHFWAAKFFDVKVEAFAFGFGPRLFGFKKGETDFKVCAIPLGGYVKMHGELPGEEGYDDPRSFLNKPRWQRMIIAFAGPAMNILLAVLLMTGLLMKFHRRPVFYDKPADIGYVTPNSPAEKAGLKPGDRIVRIADQADPTWDQVTVAVLSNVNDQVPLVVEREGKTRPAWIMPKMDDRGAELEVGWEPKSVITVEDVDETLDAKRQGLQSGDKLIAIDGEPASAVGVVHQHVRSSEGKPVQVTYSRNGVEKTISITPTMKQVGGEAKPRYLIGVTMSVPTVPVNLTLPEAFRESVKENYKSAGMLFSLIRGIVATRVSAKSLEGPISIARHARRAAKQDWLTYLSLMAMVSLNLAVFNLLPIPILDGGVILLLAIEMIFRRDLSLRVKEAIFRVGFVFLMFLVVFVFYNDITKLFTKG